MLVRNRVFRLFSSLLAPCLNTRVVFFSGTEVSFDEGAI